MLFVHVFTNVSHMHDPTLIRIFDCSFYTSLSVVLNGPKQLMMQLSPDQSMFFVGSDTVRALLNCVVTHKCWMLVCLALY